ncbi:hypothetical protein CJ739_3392 [Mariniflexile rhizosphaerae]|uniref:GNAT family N-acetyltransferase n=1 Tax=unclassified Mariniflexile TaxID=2643887 RepID=UPI000CAA3DBE|nr:GNAT family N-acetyltransferase [Mariniflexile sp. TRM1-10]AXP82454.1 hypothetical protein CJ739_3392 [Mariniflexile sp. TRM1-10]PLB18396.1 MAG: hypothetical protein TRG1_2785 [Flavobacteriaceae bacterium FS1-H7996/R]
MLLSKLFNTKYLAYELFLNDELSDLYVPHILNKKTNTEIKESITSKNTAVKLLTIVCDMPSYLQIQSANTNKKLGQLNIKQYKGFLVNLSNHSTVTSYMDTHLSKRNKKNLFSKQRKLELNHQIRYEVFTGIMEKKEYDYIFEVFYNLLKERFKEKKIYNRYLPKWSALQASSYEKIVNKKASLHVIFDKDKPISITLNYHLADITFSHIQAYDINYSNYNLGDISIYKQLEWCILNDKTIFDLSIGKTDYKSKWCNETYVLNYHIFYKKHIVLPVMLAYATKMELLTKQFLRDKTFIGNKWSIDKIKYRLN